MNHAAAKPSGHPSLRLESLLKRKRVLDLTSQRLIYDKDCLALEQKNLDLKLSVNDNEYERLAIEKRRLELALQKYHCEYPSVTNGNHNANLSDQDELDENPSLDDMSDINE